MPTISSAVNILITMYRELCCNEISNDETVVKVVVYPSEMNHEEEIIAELS